ncbi:unnamed protein product, partial [Choristocarpus tenellus]
MREGWLVCLSTPVSDYMEGRGTSLTSSPHINMDSSSGIQVGKEKVEMGLIRGDSYLLISTVEIQGGTKLLRLQGPLARGGWCGEWKESSPQWTPEVVARLSEASREAYSSETGEEGHHNRDDDGGDAGDTFWVSIEEAVSYFAAVGVCMVAGSGGHGWVEARRRLLFVWGWEGHRAGARTGTGVTGASQAYSLAVYKTSRMFFCLHQQDPRRVPSEPCLDVVDAGVTILRLQEGRGMEVVASTGNPAQKKTQVGTVLIPGRYIVVPTATGCLVKEDRLQCDASQTAHRRGSGCMGVWAGGGGGFSSLVEAALMDVFETLDADCDGVLGKEEASAFGHFMLFRLDAFLRTTEGLPLEDNVHAWLVNNFSSVPCPRPPGPLGLLQHHVQREAKRSQSPGQGEGSTASTPTAATPRRGKCGGVEGGRGTSTSQSEGLCITRQGFVEMYRCMWQASGRDPEVVMRDLRYLGYGNDLQPVRRLRAVLSIHADQPGFELIAQPFDPQAQHAALTLPVKRWGSRHYVKWDSNTVEAEGVIKKVINEDSCAKEARNRECQEREGEGDCQSMTAGDMAESLERGW